MKDFSKNILAEIKKQDITPIPKWRFLLKNYGIWAIFALLMVLGSLSVSVVIFMLTDHDWDIYQYLHKSLFEYILIAIPYFWLLFILGFLAFAYYDLRKTDRGYKYSFVKIGSINIVFSVLLGTVFFYAGLGSKIDQVFANNFPYYQNIHRNVGQRIWQNPENGLLTGRVVSFQDDNLFNVLDMDNHNWLVQCINCLWSGNIVGETGMMVKLIGKITGNMMFSASEIRPAKIGCAGTYSGVPERGCQIPKPGVINFFPMRINN